MNLRLLDPEGDLTVDVVVEALADVGAARPADELKDLTLSELAVVYDWARREVLARNPRSGVQRRPRPHLVDLVSLDQMPLRLVDEQARTIADQALEIEGLKTRLEQAETELEQAAALLADAEESAPEIH